MTVENVSFVVVAKNEALAIRKCLDSLANLDLVDCELICVDSGSSDETPSIMYAYAVGCVNGQFISVPGCRNSAEARNVGKARASKKWTFFVDGDIELYPPFVKAALAELTNGAADAVTGGLDELLYSDVSGVRITDPYVRHGFSERTKLMSCGGTFVAARQALDVVGDYDERFDRSQDLDFTLRLSSVATLVGLPIPMGVHHTREYRTRPWEHVKNGYVLCQGMLARKHHRRKGFYKEWTRSRKSYIGGLVLVCAVLASGLSVVHDVRNGWLFLSTVGVMLLIEAAYSTYKRQTFSTTLVLHVISPVLIVVGFILEPYTRASTGGRNYITGQHRKQGKSAL